MYCVLCPVSCVLCPVSCVLCTVYCVLCIVYCVLCIVWCVVCGVWCVVCGVWCVVCGVWCVVCFVLCVVSQFHSFTVSLLFNACDVTTQLAPDAPSPRRIENHSHAGSHSHQACAHGPSPCSRGRVSSGQQRKRHKLQTIAATETGAVRALLAPPLVTVSSAHHAAGTPT